MRTLTIFSLCLFLTGCYTMVKVPGLDNLHIIKHVVSATEIRSICAQRMGVPVALTYLAEEYACNTVYLDTWTCEYFVTPNSSLHVVEHELQHCDGYDHWPFALRDGFAAWQAKQPKD